MFAPSSYGSLHPCKIITLSYASTSYASISRTLSSPEKQRWSQAREQAVRNLKKREEKALFRCTHVPRTQNRTDPNTNQSRYYGLLISVPLRQGHLDELAILQHHEEGSLTLPQEPRGGLQVAVRVEDRRDEVKRPLKPLVDGDHLKTKKRAEKWG